MVHYYCDAGASPRGARDVYLHIRSAIRNTAVYAYGFKLIALFILKSLSKTVPAAACGGTAMFALYRIGCAEGRTAGK